VYQIKFALCMCMNSIKFGKFLDHPNDYQLLKKDSLPLSYVHSAVKNIYTLYSLISLQEKQTGVSSLLWFA
jgi:hypothetical protein